MDLAWMVHDNDLRLKGRGSRRWVFLGITSHVASFQVLDGNMLDIKANIVTRNSLREVGVVHFN